MEDPCKPRRLAIFKHIFYGKRINIKISNVFYVREMDRNLLSYAKVTDKNNIVSKDNTSRIYNEYNKLIASIQRKQIIYNTGLHSK